MQPQRELEHALARFFSHGGAFGFLDRSIAASGNSRMVSRKQPNHSMQNPIVAAAVANEATSSSRFWK